MAVLLLAALTVGYFVGLFFPIQISQKTLLTGKTPASADACVMWKTSEIVLKRPFKREGLYAFVTGLPELKHLGDTMQEKRRSQLVLCEDGHTIGMPHSEHDDVRTLGGGRYSHWIDGFYFSTPDNSDPNSNGRIYTIIIPTASPRG